jgi:hypothetical protein
VNIGEQWGCEKTPLKPEYTIPRKAATQKPRNRLEHIRKLRLESRCRLSTGTILMLTWIRPTDIIQAKLLNAVDANPLEEAPPQFLYSKFVEGVFWIVCANETTKAWLM